MLNFPPPAPPWSRFSISISSSLSQPELINWWQQTESLIPAKLSNFLLKLNFLEKRNLSFFFCCKNSFVLKINKSHWNLMEIFLLLRGNKLRTLELLEGTWSNIRICTETSNTTLDHVKAGANCRIIIFLGLLYQARLITRSELYEWYDTMIVTHSSISVSTMNLPDQESLASWGGNAVVSW